MGFAVGKNRVARMMKEIGLRSIVRRKYRATTYSKHSHPVAENLLKRDFTASCPDSVWVLDITYIATKRGWSYLTVFIDLFSPQGRRMGIEQLVENADGAYGP